MMNKIKMICTLVLLVFVLSINTANAALRMAINTNNAQNRTTYTSTRAVYPNDRYYYQDYGYRNRFNHRQMRDYRNFNRGAYYAIQGSRHNAGVKYNYTSTRAVYL